MLAAIRALWLLSIAAFGGVVALVYASSIDGSEAEADAYARALRDAPALDARLDRDVMRTRAGLINSYDPVVADLAELEALRARLLGTPRFLPAAARADLDRRVQGWAAALDEKKEVVDEFKKHDAVLKNSTRFLPEGAAELGTRLRPEPGGAVIAARVDDLTRDALRYELLPERDARERAERSLAAIGQDDREEARLLATHARIILEHKPRVDAALEGISKLPTVALAEAMDGAYSRQYQSIVAAGVRRKIAMILVAVAVVALGAADGLLRMRRTAAAQRELSVQLAKTNLALRREQEREKELSELKSGFVSMASHEFRTPLSVILSSTEMLETYWERWPAGKKREHFLRIQAAMKTMTLLLDQILVIGRADAGRLDLSPEPMDLRAFCDELAAAMRQTTRGERVIEVETKGDLAGVALDEKLLRHILTNLLSNAVKYSGKDSSVTLAVEVGGDHAVFSVKDCGIGIPPEDRPRLFESFHRCSNVGDVKGTGLGLAVVKRSVERHGGSIEVSSELGSGTEFVITLPTGRSGG